MDILQHIVKSIVKDAAGDALGRVVDRALPQNTAFRLGLLLVGFVLLLAPIFMFFSMIMAT